MNADILDKPLVLSLNRAWQPIGHRTVRQALVAITGGEKGDAPAVALDIVYERNADGTWNFDDPQHVMPVAWADWLALPIRDFDFVINSPKQAVRVPTVIVSTQFDRMPMRQARLSRDAVFERDGGVCQYTGERVGREGGNLDHVIPRAFGGANSFDNLVWAKKEINTRKADRTPAKAGLRLIRPPRAPRPMPVAAFIRTARHPDWRHFLTA